MGKILSIDLSTHAGFALFNEQGELIRHGTINIEMLPEQFPSPYPFNYVDAAYAFVHKQIYDAIIRLHDPEVVVIEETVPGQETYSQKMLEFLHYALIKDIQVHNSYSGNIPIKVVYLRTGEWRKAVGLRMTKEDKKGNVKKNLKKAQSAASYIRAAIKLAGTSKKNQAQVEDLKRQLKTLQLGKVTRKHLSVRLANSLFNLDLKLVDNNAADAICLGVGYFKGAIPADGLRPKVSQKTPIICDKE